MQLRPLECPKCGAPIATGGQPVIVCRFCQTSFHAPQAAADPADAAASFGATIAMDDSTVLAFCMARLGGSDNVYFSPDVPERKEKNAREMHARHLPADERILVLFDNTVFGAADDGFVVTSRRLCWRNIVLDPGMFEWWAIDPQGIQVKDTNLHVMGHEIQVALSQGLAEKCVEPFRVLASSARALRGG